MRVNNFEGRHNFKLSNSLVTHDSFPELELKKIHLNTKDITAKACILVGHIHATSTYWRPQCLVSSFLQIL